MDSLKSITRNLRWRGLTTQLFLFLVLPLSVIASIVIISSLSLHQNAMRTLIAERDQSAAGAIASALGAEFNHRAISLQGFAQRVAESNDPASVLANSTYLLDDYDSGLAVISPDGDLLVASLDLFPWTELPRIEGQFDFSSVSTVAGKPTFFPLTDFPEPGDFHVIALISSNAQSPLVAGVFSVSFAEDLIAEAFPSRDQTGISLVDTEHQIVYQTGAINLDMTPIRQSIDSALAGDFGAENIVWQDQQYVIAHAPVAPMGWALIIQESWESIESPILRTTQTAPLFLLPIILFALLALWFEARQIVRPLQALQEKAADSAWGNLEAMKSPVGGIEEIRRLQTELVHLTDRVQKAQSGLHRYIGAITAGQEEERRRISGDLHDETIQSLIALNQRVQLSVLSTTEPEVKKQLGEIQSLVDQAITDLRNIIRALRPPYLEDLGLSASVGMLCQDQSMNSSLNVFFKLTGQEKRLEPDKELAFYRIAQEAINNASRHAKAKNIWVELFFEPQLIRLIVKDDGEGFDVPESPAEFAPSGHFGLLGIHEKAELIGARFEIVSAKGKGTEIRVSLQIH